MIDLKDKLAVVTGATGGIGEAIVKSFHEHGAEIIMVGRRKEKLDELTNNNSYKVILFDKECEDLNLPEFSSSIKAQNTLSSSPTHLVLITDSSAPNDPLDKEYVDETIKNVINKDLLRLVIEKFI